MAVVNSLPGTITRYGFYDRSDAGVNGWGIGGNAPTWAMDWDQGGVSAGPGFNTNTAAMQCAWTLMRETGMGSSGLNFDAVWDGICPTATPNVTDTYQTDGFQPVGWVYNYTAGGLFADDTGYRAYIGRFGEQYAQGYSSTMQRPYGGTSNPSTTYEVWTPGYNEALTYNWSRTDDDQLAEFVDITWRIEVQPGNFDGQLESYADWSVDQTVELWRQVPPTTAWMGTVQTRGHDPSTFQGQYVATFPPTGGTTYTITKTGADLGIGGWPGTNAQYTANYERYLLIPTALWNPSRPSHGFSPAENTNYSDYHMGPSFQVAIFTRWRSCAYKRYYIEEFSDNSGSSEWSAVLTDSPNDSGSYIKVCSPEGVEFESGPYPNANLLHCYDLTNGYSILADFNNTWRKVQISKTEGVTVLATNTDPYFVIDELRSARSHPAGIHVLDRFGNAYLYDHTTLAGLGSWVVPGAVSDYTTGHGFFGDVIQVDGDINFYVSKTAADGLGFDETVYVPTGVDHNGYDYDVAVYTFDEWGVGYLCVNSSEYWEDSSSDLLYTYIYSFDTLYRFRPGYIKVPAAYAWSSISAWPVRGSTGMTLFRMDDPTRETEFYNGLEIDSNMSGIARLSVAGLSTTTNALTSDWRTLCEGVEFAMYPGWAHEYPHHTGGGGGFATTWGAKLGDGSMNNFNRLSVSGFSETVGSGNTVLETETTTSSNLLYNGGVVSLGPLSAPELDGELTEKERKFWRNRPY